MRIFSEEQPELTPVEAIKKRSITKKKKVDSIRSEKGGKHTCQYVDVSAIIKLLNEVLMHTAYANGQTLPHTTCHYHLHWPLVNGHSVCRAMKRITIYGSCKSCNLQPLLIRNRSRGKGKKAANKVAPNQHIVDSVIRHYYAQHRKDHLPRS